MESKDVIEVKIKSIKRTIRGQGIILAIMLLVKVIFLIMNMFMETKSETLSLDIVILSVIVVILCEIPKLCDVLLKISERTSAPKDKQD